MNRKQRLKNYRKSPVFVPLVELEDQLKGSESALTKSKDLLEIVRTSLVNLKKDLAAAEDPAAKEELSEDISEAKEEIKKIMNKILEGEELVRIFKHRLRCEFLSLSGKERRKLKKNKPALYSRAEA